MSKLFFDTLQQAEMFYIEQNLGSKSLEENWQTDFETWITDECEIGDFNRDDDINNQIKHYEEEISGE